MVDKKKKQKIVLPEEVKKLIYGLYDEYMANKPKIDSIIDFEIKTFGRVTGVMTMLKNKQL